MTSKSGLFAGLKGYLIVGLLGLCIGLGSGYRFWYTPAPFPLVQVGKITKVTDGDTVDVDVGGRSLTLRLMGIQAPETNQCFGTEATTKLAELKGKSVKIEFLPVDLPIKFDMYGGRALAYLHYKGENYNLKLIREGYAHEYTVGGAYDQQNTFRSAHCDAKAYGRGMWAKEGCGIESVKGYKRACIR
jgi:endonuclease YncB( thermonuclease family)